MTDPFDRTIARIGRPVKTRKPIAIASDSDGSSDATVLCDDGSVWKLAWGRNSGWEWYRVPDVPQDDGGAAQ